MPAIKEAASAFLANRRIAVTGVSRTPKDHAANAVYKRLRDRGYEVFAVNPFADQVEGARSYHGLVSIPGGVEAVVIATAPGKAEGTMRECVAACRRTFEERAERAAAHWTLLTKPSRPPHAVARASLRLRSRPCTYCRRLSVSPYSVWQTPRAPAAVSRLASDLGDGAVANRLDRNSVVSLFGFPFHLQQCSSVLNLPASATMRTHGLCRRSARRRTAICSARWLASWQSRSVGPTSNADRGKADETALEEARRNGRPS